MRLLAIDTSTSAIAVALHDGGSVLDREAVLDPRGHAEQLAPAIARILTRLDLPASAITHVVAGTGPGPFTGLRVGLVTAVTFGYALGVPVGGLCSLDVLAHQAWRAAGPSGPAREFTVATDARRKEVYWATYRREDGHPRVGRRSAGQPDAGQPDAGQPDAGEPPADGQPPVVGEHIAGLTRVTGPRVDRAGDIAAVPGGGRVGELPVTGRGGVLYPQAFGPHLGILDVDAGVLADLAAAILGAGGTLPAPTPRYLRRPDARPLPGAFG